MNNQPQKRSGEPRQIDYDVHLSPEVFATGKAYLDHALALAISGNTTLQGFIVAAADNLKGDAPRQQNRNSREVFSALKLPDDQGLRNLWNRLAEGQGKGKSDSHIARAFHRAKGPRFLKKLQMQRPRGKISNWKTH